MCTCSHGQEAEVTLTCGDDYLAADSRALCFSQGCGESWPTAAASNLTLTISPVQCGSAQAITGVYTAGTPAKACFDLPRSQTITLAPGKRAYTYTVRGTLATGGVQTFARGNLTVLPS